MKRLSKTHKDVEVVEHLADFSDIAWSTLRRLTRRPNPGTELDTSLLLWECMAEANTLGTRFLNPMFTVSSNAPTSAFICEARRAQRRWLQVFRQSLHCSSSQLKRLIRQENFLLRQLMYTGVMVIRGTHTRPDQWPLGNEPLDLVRVRFGRLIVVAKSKCGRWLCRCDCGAMHEVRQQHLTTGRIRSCGCLKLEHEEQARVKREKRQWMWS